MSKNMPQRRIRCLIPGRPRLISKWRTCWKLTSIQAAALLALFNLFSAEILPLFNFVIPQNAMNWINALMGVTIIVLRIIVQPSMVIDTTKRQESPDA